MKTLFAAAVAALFLSGCIAVPAPYADGYYAAPAVGVGFYSVPHRHHHHHGHWRHHRGHHRHH